MILLKLQKFVQFNKEIRSYCENVSAEGVMYLLIKICFFIVTDSMKE